MTEEENELMQFIENAKVNGYNVLCLLETTRDDKNFWSDMWHKHLQEYKPDFHCFRGSSKDKEGKKIIRRYLSAGEKLSKTEKICFCIDADYDILTQNPLFANKNYILHTEGYAIESLCLLPETLNHFAKSRFHKNNFDFVVFFEEYSKIIFDVFCYALYFAERQHLGEQRKEQMPVPNEITADKLKTEIGFIQNDKLFVINDNAKKGLENIKLRVARLLQTLKENHPAIDIELIKQKLQNDFQISPSQTYMYVNSHIVFENIVRHLFDMFKNEAVKADIKKQHIEFETEKEKITEEQKKAAKDYEEKIILLKSIYTHSWSLNHYHPLLEKVGENMKKSFENM